MDCSGVAGVPQGTYVTGLRHRYRRRLGWSGFLVRHFHDRRNTRNAGGAKTQQSCSMQVSSPGGTATGTTAQICFDITEVADVLGRYVAHHGSYRPDNALEEVEWRHYTIGRHIQAAALAERGRRVYAAFAGVTQTFLR
jgi:hypothetical protein